MIYTLIRHALVRDQARAPGGVWVTCGSDSMVPTVRPQQNVCVRATEQLRAGDVVLFETTDGAALVLHRVVFASALLPWFVHVGDAGKRAGIAHRDRVIGRADLPRRRPSVRALVLGLRRVGEALRPA